MNPEAKLPSLKDKITNNDLRKRLGALEKEVEELQKKKSDKKKTKK